MNKLALAIPFFAVVYAISADTLILRNGSIIKGAYLGGTAQTFKMQVGETVQTYSVKDVESLSIGDNQPAPRTLAPQPAAASSPAPSATTPPATTSPTSATEAVDGVVAAGSTVTIRLIDSIDSAKSQPGDTFRASLDEPIVQEGQTMIPRGSDAVVKLVAEKEANKITGKPELTLELVSLTSGDRVYPVRSQSFTQAGASRTTRSAEVIGGGTALGAIIGAVAGGGKGAAIGALSGAGAGTAVQVLTKGAKVQVPSETRLSFILQDPIRL